MNAKKVTLVVAGSLVAFALAAAPTSRDPREPVAAGQPTPHSADHARIQGAPEELPAQF